MPRPPVATSAFEAFPASEFDAWVDKLRNTIITGLEPDIPEVHTPILSKPALEAIESAKEEAARAEEAAAQRAEEETRALQRELAARHAAAVELHRTTIQSPASPASDAQHDRYAGTLEQLFERQRQRDVDDRVSHQKRSAGSEEAQSVTDDDEMQTREEDEEDEDEEEQEVGIDTVHRGFQPGEVLNHRFATQQNYIEEEFVDGADDPTEYYAQASLSPVPQPEYDNAFVDGAGDQTDILTHRYPQTGPIEVGSDTDDEDGPEDGSGEDTEEGSKAESDEGSDQGSGEESEEGPEKIPTNTVGDSYVRRGEQSRHLTSQMDRNEAAFEESDQESEAPAELEQEQELESQDERMCAQGFTREPAIAPAYIGEEENDDQDEFLHESGQDGDIVSEEDIFAPPEGYARRVFSSIRVNDQGAEQLFHRVEFVSEQEEGQDSESGADDATDSQRPERHQASAEDNGHEDEEIDVAQGGQYDMAARQIYVPTESLSRGGEEDVIEVDDDSNKESEQESDRTNDIPSERRQQDAVTRQPAGSMDDQSGEELSTSEESSSGSDRSQSEESSSSSDGSQSFVHSRQQATQPTRTFEEYTEFDNRGSHLEDDDARSENEDTNSIIGDGDYASSVRSVNNEARYSRDDGVDELADDDMHEEEAAYLPQPTRYPPPRPSDLWEASELIDPALQTSSVLRNAVTEVTYVSSDADAVNRVWQASSSIAIQETVQSPTTEQVISIQPESSIPVADLREDELAYRQEDMMTDDAQIIDARSFSAEEIDVRHEDANELTSMKHEESTTPVDQSTRPEASHGIADLPGSSTAAAFNCLYTPLLSNATTECEADDEQSARRLPSTSPSKETFANVDLAENATETLSQTGSVHEGVSSPARDNPDMDGAVREGDEGELDADANVSSNGDDSQFQATYVSEAGDDDPRADPASPADVATALRSTAEPQAVDVEVQNAFSGGPSPHDGRVEADAEKGLQSRDRDTSPTGEPLAVSEGILSTSEDPESHLFTEPDTNRSLQAESSGIQTGIIPEAAPFDSHPRGNEDEGSLENRKTTFNTASPSEGTVTIPSAMSDEDMGLHTSALESLEPEQGAVPHAQVGREATPTVAFDRNAEFVAIASPSESGKDELEEGEIRSSDEAELSGEKITRHAVVHDLAIEGEKSIQSEEDLDNSSTSEGSQEEDHEDRVVDDLPPTRNADGTRRGSAEVMGSQQEGVRVDETATMDEDDGDATPNPDYDADSRDSAENVRYDSEDLPLEENDGIEVDPEDSEALQAEIRSHDLSDIPHKEEHLVEEDEEYNDDEPEHHTDGRPVGYEGYDVVDETNPEDIMLFEVAERSHDGIEGERTTEQLMIQEMELRQQPGNAVRAERDSSDSAPMAIDGEETLNQDEIMPSAPWPEQIHDTPAGDKRERSLSQEGAVPPVVFGTLLPNEKEQGESDAALLPGHTDIIGESRPSIAGNFQPAGIGSGTYPMAPSVIEEDDIFDVPSSAQPSHHTEPRASVVALLDVAALPEPPQLGRSPSPLAPESLLQRDASLAMEPTPLLHKHDQHHNVVLVESHRIHEAKRQSFVSAIASVHEDVSAPGDSGKAGSEEDGHADNDNVHEGEQPSGEMQSQETSQTPPIRPQESLEAAAMENEDDDEDPLRLNGPFDDSETMAPSRMERTEVYVELPAMGRAKSHSPEDRQSITQPRLDGAPTGPVTPLRPPMFGADPTRHHHAPVPSASFSSIRTDYSDISGSPAAHTRSQCHYHKIRFGRGVFSHIVLVPHCSIGTDASREQMGATDLGRVTKEEMGKKRDLIFGNTFTSRMTSDVEPLPENLEHQVRQLAGSDLLREGHIWLLPLEDVAPESPLGQTDGDLNDYHNQNAYHLRFSPRLQPSSQTPDRKRKRGSSHARSTSVTRSDGDMAATDQRRSHSPSRVHAPREISQITEHDEENLQEGIMEKADEEEMDDQQDERSHQGLSTAEVNNEGSETGTDQGDGNDMQEITSEQAISPTHMHRHDESEEYDAEELPNKKRVIELENGEGPSAVKITPARKKAGWLSWLLGRKQ
ncbi:hypothetical protein QFC21_001268 [Naganishia friedmannii]|uniref:Uncharacterized protein n=1 Tax=Naganishia friedmannii TaxID=89922 RepID=A0ACC2W4Z0_9TREE|nr:hypothetical protein QFC21_001268 [Naganishia friedmannii]